MAVSDIANTWDKIRQGVKDAEMLITQKKYNLSMVKSRQVLELMVDYLCSTASFSEEDLASSIDTLYENEWISKATCEHYHKIRMLGNKAVHEGNDNGYDANQAYHLLSQEVYTFANDYKKGRSGGKPAAAGRGGSASRASSGGRERGRSSGSGRQGGRDSGDRSPGRRDGSRNSGRRGSGSRNSKSQGNRSRRRQKPSGFSLTPVDLIRLGLLLAVVVIIALAVRFITPKDQKEEETSSSSVPVQTTAWETMPPTTAPPVETMADTTPAPVYKTSSALNVRSEPSTAGEILTVLEVGTIVDYVEDYDDEWIIINYNGVQAYVSSQYLVHD